MIPPGHVVPPMVYLPCADATPADGELDVDLRHTRNGRVALLVYSALDRLVSCCGPRQPWVVVPTGNLGAISERTPVDLILFDVEIPVAERRGVR